MQKINRKEYSLTSSVFKLWYVLFTKLKYYYHRLLRRTLQGPVRYSPCIEKKISLGLVFVSDHLNYSF